MEQTVKMLNPQQTADKMSAIDPMGKWTAAKVYNETRKGRFPRAVMFSKHRWAWKEHKVEEHIQAILNGDMVYYEASHETLHETPEPVVRHVPRPQVKLEVLDIPVPPAKTWGAHNSPGYNGTSIPYWKKYGLDQIPSGKCILVPYSVGKKEKTSIVNSAATWGKKQNPAVRFRFAKLDEKQSWGVWRLDEET